MVQQMIVFTSRGQGAWGVTPDDAHVRVEEGTFLLFEREIEDHGDYPRVCVSCSVGGEIQSVILLFADVGRVSVRRLRNNDPNFNGVYVHLVGEEGAAVEHTNGFLVAVVGDTPDQVSHTVRLIGENDRCLTDRLWRVNKCDVGPQISCAHLM